MICQVHMLLALFKETIDNAMVLAVYMMLHNSSNTQHIIHST